MSVRVTHLKARKGPSSAVKDSVRDLLRQKETPSVRRLVRLAEMVSPGCVCVCVCVCGRA